MRNIKAHTGLRGIAAVAVFLGHAQFDRLWPHAAWLGLIYGFFYWQNPAVDLFFMLSGFVLNYAYLKHRRIDWSKYFLARFARICPLYYAGLFAILVMNVAAMRSGRQSSPDFQPSLLIPNLLMVQEWPAPVKVTSINFPSWSISVEVFLYIAIFPLLAWLYASGSGGSRRNSLIALVVATVANGFFGSGLITLAQFPYLGLARGISGFAAGFLLCEVIWTRDGRLFPWSVEALLALAMMAILPFHSWHFVLPALFIAFMAVTYPASSWLGKFLGSAFIYYLGELSYSIYIWHFPVIKACTLIFGMRHVGELGMDHTSSTTQSLLYCAGTIAALAVVANVSYYWFETPAREILRSPRNILRKRVVEIQGTHR